MSYRDDACLFPTLYFIDEYLEEKKRREERERRKLYEKVEKILSEPTMEELYLEQLAKKYEDDD